jgi:lipoprotein-anchoring transpeptidase ErfK/SrfK
MTRCLTAAVALCAMISAAPSAQAAADLTPGRVNEAGFEAPAGREISPVVLKAQILLDRLRFSPGVIDGHLGDNLSKAIVAFEKAQGLPTDGKLDQKTWDRLIEAAPREPVLTEYTIEEKDVSGPFAKEIPDAFEKLAELDRLAYRNPRELLAERFHMDEDLLAALNRGRAFDAPGTTIVVADPRPDNGAREIKGERIEIDKSAGVVRLLDSEGKALAVYPASIGSEEKPAPSGTHTVRAVAKNPVYTYNPEYKFKGVKADKPFQIKPGPNNPVGTVWIDLSAESFGIHGTPEPAKVGKVASQGCVRLTNWDVEELAALVKKGMPAVFVD